MKRIKLFFGLILAVAVVTVVFPLQAQAQGGSLGVFDLQKCLNDSKKGKQARSSLEAKFKKMQTELQAKEKEINKLSTELRKMVEAKNSKPEDLRKKDETLKKKVNIYQEQLGKYNNDMRKSEETSLKPLVDKAVSTAGELGRKRGYVAVLEVQQAGVVYVMDGNDLTSEIIKAIDR